MNWLIPVMIGAADMANLFYKNIGPYLAGLIEGDGYIYNTKKKSYIGITFNLKDKILAENLLKLFEKGHIVKRKTNSLE
jgi:hypothetical protein